MASATTTSFYTIMASLILFVGLAAAAPVQNTLPHIRQTRSTGASAENLKAAYTAATKYMKEVKADHLMK